MIRSWPHRATPIERTVPVRGRRGTTAFEYRVGKPSEYVFTVDVYAYGTYAHPDRHLGWWRFELPEGQGRATLAFDFAAVRRESLSAAVDGRALPVVDCWYNSAFAFDPLADMQLALRDGAGEIRRIEPILLKFLDRDILIEFYARQYATQGYGVSPTAPFLLELHEYKMRRLRELFERYIPVDGRVVDVGCGRSLFADMGVRFPFKVFAGDLDFASVRDRAGEVPWQSWGVFDAAQVPFGAGQFDALFAGEVIEHVPDVRQTLREWNRVLKPGGIAIITTPNRERLVARADGLERPYSRDHLSELSYRELSGSLLRDSGFEFVTQRCIYVELWLRHLFAARQRVQDFLQSDGNRRQYRWAMRLLHPLGRLFPSVSLAMVVVARKVK
jgi:2-polyprenyl-3-methyl-5-hydroxy-6-metoxy-1,4-benzoquinol methylase